MYKLLYISFILGLLPTIALSQQQAEIYQLSEGQALRESPPTGGFLNLPGDVKSKTRQTHPYVVLRIQKVQQGFKMTQWAEVASVSPNGAIDQEGKGWVLLPTDQDYQQQLKPFASDELSISAKHRLQIEFEQESNL